MQVADRAYGSVLMEQEPELQDQWRSESRRTPKIMLDHAVVPWVTVTRGFLTKASGSAREKRLAKEISEADEGKLGKGGEEGADCSKVREEVVYEVIERVKQDPELDGHEQRLLGCIVDLHKFVR